MSNSHLARSILVAAVLGAATPAFAHTGHDHSFTLLTGVLHPLTGPDHLVAMLCVGLWSAFVGGRSVYAWPAAFVAAMIVGALVAHSGMVTLGVETMIMASLLVIGTLLASGVRLPVAAGAALVAVFAFVHGFAHGAEAPLGSFGTYVVGFSATTALIHVAGIALGLALIHFQRPVLARFAGAATAAFGLVLLIG